MAQDAIDRVDCELWFKDSWEAPMIIVYACPNCHRPMVLVCGLRGFVPVAWWECVEQCAVFYAGRAMQHAEFAKYERRYPDRDFARAVRRMDQGFMGP